MKKNEYEKLRKNAKPNEIIWKHIKGCITLTSKQLDEVIKIRKGITK